MVNKPGRQKPRKRNWTVVAAILIVVILAGAVGWYVYSANSTTTKAEPILARIETSKGSFDILLYPASAPKTVNNFVNLARSGFYTDLVWHRIVKGFVIQTGDDHTRGGSNSTRSTWGTGGSTYQVPFEFDPNLLNVRGSIAMASVQKGTGGTSQFYINLVDNPALDGGYAVFGMVLNSTGMAVVDKIANVPVYSTNDQPIDPVFVLRITIIGPTTAASP